MVLSGSFTKTGETHHTWCASLSGNTCLDQGGVRWCQVDVRRVPERHAAPNLPLSAATEARIESESDGLTLEPTGISETHCIDFTSLSGKAESTRVERQWYHVDDIRGYLRYTHSSALLSMVLWIYYIDSGLMVSRRDLGTL